MQRPPGFALARSRELTPLPVRGKRRNNVVVNCSVTVLIAVTRRIESSGLTVLRMENREFDFLNVPLGG